MSANGSPRAITLDTGTMGEPLQHFWTTLACAGRAAEGLRAGWQNQLRRLQEDTGFRYIRFHGIFHDDMMVYRETGSGSDVKILYNWHYIDELFDFLLSVGIRPFLELGFMPADLASGDATCFRWRGNITPPRDWDRWGDLVGALVRHCIGRYGLDEVRTWYFEVWNEPNLDEYFWRGTQEEYFHLYRTSAWIIKSIDAGLRVGGPATSNFAKGEAPWIRDFLEYCGREGLPVDFISSHPYPNHWPLDPATSKRRVAFRGPDALEHDAAWLKAIVAASAFPAAAVHITEWNSSFLPWDPVHDTAFMGPFIVMNALRARGSLDSLGFWTFTDVFEETGAGYTPFHGGFGLMTYRGIPKPSFHAYRFLSRLGTRLTSADDWYACTRYEEPSLGWRILIWNYAHFSDDYYVPGQFDLPLEDPYQAFEETEAFDVELCPQAAELCPQGKPSGAFRWRMHRLSRTDGSAFDAWVSMGRPGFPTLDEYRHLSASAEPVLSTGCLAPEETLRVTGISAHTLILLELWPDA